MRLTKLLPLAAAAAICVALPARAQEAVHIGVANPAKIFNAMVETTDLKQKLDSEAQAIKAQDDTKKGELRDLQVKRDSFKPGTQPFDDANKVLLQKAIEYRAWAETMNQEQQRIQKQQIRSLYEKIAAAAGEIAAAKGFEIVIAEGPELPPTVDQITREQLEANINQRNVLYAKPGVDITQEVLTKLDAAYKAGGGAAAPAAPATPAAPAEGTTPAPPVAPPK